MNMPHAKPVMDASEGETLRDALARGNIVLGKIGPILGHLLSTPDHSLFSDEIVARVRGMLQDLAWQVLRAQAEATGQAGREEFADQHGEALAEHFHASPMLLSHCHSLALEWQLSTRLEATLGVDPVLSPLMQTLIASEDSAVASAAMAALSAQARYAQAQKRMELPLSELPGDLFHDTLMGWRAYTGDKQSDAMIRAEAKLRNGYDEGAARLALFARLVASMGIKAKDALSIEEAGVGLFFTALGACSGQTRELAILSSNARQMARFALGLRAAGLDKDAVEREILRIHPDGNPPRGLSDVTQQDAREMLADGDHWGLG